MSDGAATVPVTVTVSVPRTQQPPGGPGGPLPFTGAPIEVLASFGVALTVAGAAVIAAVRRSTARRSQP